MLVRSPKELGLLVAGRRKKLKLSQTKLANLVGLKQKTISAFENNAETAEVKTLFKILSAVKLDLNLYPKEQQKPAEIEWKEEW